MCSSFSRDLFMRVWHFAARAHDARKVPGSELPYIPHVGAVAMEVIAPLAIEDHGNPDLAVLFAFSFIVPFGFHGVGRWRHNTAARERSTSSTSPGWSRFTSSTADFSALFPVAPTEDTRTVQRPGGPESLHVMMASAGPDETYSVTRADAPLAPSGRSHASSFALMSGSSRA